MGLPNKVTEDSAITIRVIDLAIQQRHRNTVNWIVAKGRFEAHQGAHDFYRQYKPWLNTGRYAMLISIDGGEWRRMK